MTRSSLGRRPSHPPRPISISSAASTTPRNRLSRTYSPTPRISTSSRSTLIRPRRESPSPWRRQIPEDHQEHAGHTASKAEQEVSLQHPGSGARQIEQPRMREKLLRSAAEEEPVAAGHPEGHDGSVPDQDDGPVPRIEVVPQRRH